jgi:hypothetical protein
MMFVFYVPKEFKHDRVSFANDQNFQRKSSKWIDCGSLMHI